MTCQLVGDNVNLYYYTLQDVQYGNPSPSFGIKPAGDLQSVSPLFDLSCPASSVSPLLPLLLSSALSPLLFLLLYNLAVAKSVLEHVMPAVWRCDCPCLSTLHLPVHTSAWTTRSIGWSTRANGQAKSSSLRLPYTAIHSSSIVRSSTRTAVTTSERYEEDVSL